MQTSCALGARRESSEESAEVVDTVQQDSQSNSTAIMSSAAIGELSLAETRFEVEKLTAEVKKVQEIVQDAKEDAMVIRAGLHDAMRNKEAILRPCAVRVGEPTYFGGRWHPFVFAAVSGFLAWFLLFVVNWADSSGLNDAQTCQHGTVREQLEALLVEIAAEKLQSQDLKDALYDCKNTSAVLKSEKAELMDDVAGLRQSESYWRTKTAKLQDAYEKIQQATDASQEEISRLMQENRDLQYAAVTLEIENGFLSKEIQAVRSERAQLEALNRKLEKEVMEWKMAHDNRQLEALKLEEAMASCKENVASLQHSVNTWQQRWDGYRMEYEDLKKKVKARKCSHY